MNTNQNETKTQDAPQLNPRTGFYTNVMPVLSKKGEYVHFFLPGDVTVTEYANRFKGLLGFDYVPKAQNAEKREFTPRTGLHAKVRVGLSQDGQWVTVYLPGNMGRISNHVNAYKHIFKLPYEKKSKAA